MPDRCIICVDDEAIIVESLRIELEEEFPRLTVLSALSGEDALVKMAEVAEQGTYPAVLVTDERMPTMLGHRLLQKAREIYPNLYGILLTGYMDFRVVAEAVNEAGLFRYVHKPWEHEDLIMAVDRALKLFDNERELDALRAEVQRLNTAMIAVLENAVTPEPEDSDYKHVLRVGSFAALIAQGLGQSPRYVRKIYLYAPLHDIGKAGIPHAILAKPGKLSREEYDMIKTHVAIGTQLLKTIDVDPIAKDLILYHHERWDGKGYLAELKGEEIPLSARIVAVADALDAMMSRRTYKDTYSFDTASEVIVEQSGTCFDPKIVDVFESHLEKFRKIAAGDNDAMYQLDFYVPR